MAVALLPAEYTCPMHVEVRRPAPSVCPVCGMALIRAADPADPEYTMDLEPSWHRDGRSVTVALRFATAGGRPATEFAIVHERELHVMVVERQLRHFAHVHPTRQLAGTFSVDLRLPFPGEYMLFADFLPVGGAPSSFNTSSSRRTRPSSARYSPEWIRRSSPRARCAST